MEPIDKAKAVECLGSEDVFFATASSFLAESDKMLACLEEAVNSGDSSVIIEKTHWFKGGLVYLHAEPSVQAAMALRGAAEMGPAEIRTAFGKLVQEVDKLKQALSEIGPESSRSL